jgi:hypothetical protein
LTERSTDVFENLLCREEGLKFTCFFVIVLLMLWQAAAGVEVAEPLIQIGGIASA